MAYTKTNWVNDSVPAINATNLNKIEQGIYDIDAEMNTINNKLQNGYKGERLEYSNLDAFKSDLITNTFPTGIYLVTISYSQNNYGIIVQKANNNYISFIWFNYGNNPVLHKYVNGVWTNYSL